MAAIAITYTRAAVSIEGKFLWTASATVAGESLAGTGYTKNQAVTNLTNIILLARAESTTSDTKEI